MYQFTFERLTVWQRGKSLVKIIYQITSLFSRSEQFGLVSQMRRASISIVSNIAEGSGKSSRKEQAHYYEIAYSSLLELLNQLMIAFELGLIGNETYEDCRIRIIEISKMLNALRKSCFTNL